MQKFRRVFIEITNVCNLSCPFCAKSSRKPGFMSLETFENIAAQVKPLAGMVSLHVLGEPMLHPQFAQLLGVCSRLGLTVNLVTNGSRLAEFRPVLLEEKSLGQLSVSLHALECLPRAERLAKLAALVDFAKAKPDRLIIAFRLRGKSGTDFEKEVADYMAQSFGGGQGVLPNGALKLRDKVFLHHGKLFDWPGQGARNAQKGCLGLKHHFAVLCTGEVIPCCVDFDGVLAFGNINTAPLADILSGAAAAKLRMAIAATTPMPDYCATCGFKAPD